MMGRGIAVTGLALLLAGSVAAAEDRPRGAVRCEDLKWAPQVLVANPDIELACQGVYEKDGVLYAKATIEVVRAVGNTLKFRTVRNDGSLGKRLSVTLGSQWRVKLDGRDYRLSELVAGQRLDIFLPEDRFALSVVSSNEAKVSAIEQAKD